MTELLSRVLLLLKSRKRALWRSLIRCLIILLFTTGFSVAGLLAEAVFRKEVSADKDKAISLVQLCEYLSKGERWQGRNLRILTQPDFGAEILYRTAHEVMATPYHRNVDGILDTYDTMTADSDDKALELIQERGIDVILLCPTSTEAAFYSKAEDSSTFYQRLRQDSPGDWLRKVELPGNLSSSFILYEVVGQWKNIKSVF